MVKKEHVVKEEKGFLLLAGNNHSTYKDLFVRANSCEYDSIVHCFEAMKHHTGFKIGVGEADYRRKLINKYGRFVGYGFGDTLNKVYILPVKVEYTIYNIKERKKGNPYFSNSPFQMLVKMKDRKVEINYYIDRINVISVIPY